jgi:hypothetical protein
MHSVGDASECIRLHPLGRESCPKNYEKLTYSGMAVSPPKEFIEASRIFVEKIRVVLSRVIPAKGNGGW